MHVISLLTVYSAFSNYFPGAGKMKFGSGLGGMLSSHHWVPACSWVLGYLAQEKFSKFRWSRMPCIPSQSYDIFQLRDGQTCRGDGLLSEWSADFEKAVYLRYIEINIYLTVLL